MDNPSHRILLVEDEPSIRFVAERQLKVLGYTLTAVAENGLSAVEKALASDFDLIFMDIRMPELDGLSATRRIREAGKNTVIVGMTAFSQREECLDAGMNDFLQKPVMLDQLKETLSKWLKSDGSKPVEMPVLKPAINMEKFKQTELDLEELKAKIRSLRKQTGLDE